MCSKLLLAIREIFELDLLISPRVWFLIDQPPPFRPSDVLGLRRASLDIIHRFIPLDIHVKPRAPLSLPRKAASLLSGSAIWCMACHSPSY